MLGYMSYSVEMQEYWLKSRSLEKVTLEGIKVLWTRLKTNSLSVLLWIIMNYVHNLVVAS